MELVDRRQFVIMDKPYVKEDFIQITLSCGLVLSYHKDLNVNIKGNSILLGHAFSCEEENVDLEKSITERFHWSGRWILISAKKMYLDPCGSLGVFYSSGIDSNFICSSSLRIIKEILGSEWIANYQIKYNDGLPYMDYYPIPYTPCSNIKKMLPTQFFDFESFEIKDEDEQWYDQYVLYSIDELYALLKKKLLKIFSNIGKQYNGKIWIPLTGGVDSRTCIALAKASGIRFGAYTALRDNINSWDRKAPARICKRLGIEHFYMDDRVASNQQREVIYDTHCGGKVSVGTDRNQFVANNDVPNASDSIVLWGTAWEVYGRNFWGTFDLGEQNDERLNSWNDYSQGAIYKSNIHLKSLTEWLNYVEQHPMHTMDWRQRMYYEQRIGSWLSGSFQAIDLFDSIRISPVNCYDIFGILINLVDKTFAPDSRSDKRYQIQLINEFIPEVADIPYEEKNTILIRAFRKLGRIFNKN